VRAPEFWPRSSIDERKIAERRLWHLLLMFSIQVWNAALTHHGDARGLPSGKIGQR
jgi:hypothetical protein